MGRRVAADHSIGIARILMAGAVLKKRQLAGDFEVFA